MENRAVAEISDGVLKVRFLGRVGIAEIESYTKDLERLVPSLSPGFCLLTDLSNLESMEIACAPYIENMMDLLGTKGVGLVVRVVPDKTRDIGFGIMSAFHYPESVRIVTCETLAEAERVLV